MSIRGIVGYLKRGETVRDELNRIDGFVPNRAGRKHTRLVPTTKGRRPCNWHFVPIDQDHLHLETYDMVIPLQRTANLEVPEN
jgi:hypothetical protein